MSYPRFQRARDFRFVRHTANIVLNSTSWANIPGLATITLTAQVGDVLEVSFGAYHDGATTSAFLDAVTEVSASPVNSFGEAGTAPTSTALFGIPNWFCEASDDGKAAGSAWYMVVAGDLSGGLVTVRMRYRTGLASNKTLNVGVGNIIFAVKNLGPMDPN